jgi:hypothetical protein
MEMLLHEPIYFYRVSEFVTTFKLDPGKNESICYEQDFKDNDLLKCKAFAEKYYWERMKGLENSKYFLPFAGPENFVYSKNAACSLTLSLVEHYNEDEQFEYPLLGEDDETMFESRETEVMVLRQKGFI